MIQNIIAAIGALYLMSAVGALNNSSSCVPPVPPKPARLEASGRYGTMNVFPEVIKVGDTITFTVAPDITSRSVQVAPGGFVSYVDPYARDGDLKLVDWGPKSPAPGATFDQRMYKWKKGVDSAPMLPANIKYWVKLKATSATVPHRSKFNKESYGWMRAMYFIEHENQGTSEGRKLFYVGGPQKPGLELNRMGWRSGKAVTFFPNTPFDFVTTAAGQGGTMTANVMEAKLLGPATREVKPNETVTWKVLPRNKTPINFKVKLKNGCGEDEIHDAVAFKFDLSKLTKDQVDIAWKANYPITLGKKDAFTYAYLSLITKGETKVSVENIPFTARAVYADNRDEIAKSVMFYPYGGDKTPRPGQVSLKSQEGPVPMKIGASSLTEVEAKRGIIIQVITSAIPNLQAEFKLGIEVPKIEIPKSEPVLKDLQIKADRKLEGLREGDKVNLKAQLLMSDNSTRFAKEVRWVVVGPIGSVNADGVFTAALSDDVSELGEALGAIVATYKDTSGKEHSAKTDLFKVEAFVPEEEVDESQG